MQVPNTGMQVYLATCNHRPFDLSFLVRPRIPRALILRHIHESSPCCCCAALLPADIYKTQRKRLNPAFPPQTQLPQTCWPPALLEPKGAPQACCTLHIDMSFLKMMTQIINKQDMECQQPFSYHF